MENNKLTKLEKAIKIIIALSILIASLSLAYYLVIYIPKKDKIIYQKQQQREQDLENARKDCYQQVNSNFKSSNDNLSSTELMSALKLAFDRCMQSKGLSN